jgi:hypothetical protein
MENNHMSNTISTFAFSFLFISACGGSSAISIENDTSPVNEDTISTISSEVDETDASVVQQDVSDGKVITTISISMNPDANPPDATPEDSDSTPDSGEVKTSISFTNNPDSLVGEINSQEADVQTVSDVPKVVDMTIDIINSSSSTTYTFGGKTYDVSCMYTQTNKFFNDLNSNQVAFVRPPVSGDATIPQCLTTKSFEISIDPQSLRVFINTNCYGYLNDTWTLSYMNSCVI